MKLSIESMKHTEPIIQAINQHPFVQELMAGTLARDKFTFYITQDRLYLADYGRALAAIAGRLYDPEHISSFLSFANDSMTMEKAMHASFLHDVPPAAISPTCTLYTAYIARQLAFESVEVCVAAVLPCFWIYKMVGDYVIKHQTKGDNPYQSWINTYSGEEFEQAVERALNIYDELAEKSSQSQRDKMLEAFLTCSKMEWMFWDSAYRLEQWPI
ncbi:MAG: thiaminase II [Deferribacteraceae bacterium]|nr:thiaminase II [Deferribacteraceae bacterium]